MMMMMMMMMMKLALIVEQLKAFQTLLKPLENQVCWCQITCR